MSVQARQISVQARQIHDADPAGPFIALRISPADCSLEEVSVGAVSWPVVGCSSSLAVRNAMRRYVHAPTPVVLLYDGDESGLGADVLGRCAKRRLFAPDLWQTVMILFRASQVDPRLVRHRWLAELLLRYMPPEGYAPVLSVALDEERAWKEVFRHVLGFEVSLPSATDLLRWAGDASFRERYLTLDSEAKLQVVDRLVDAVGNLTRYVFAAIDTSRADDLLPVGLLCEALLPASDSMVAAQVQVVARLEAVFGGMTLDRAAITKLANAADTLFQALSDDSRQATVQRYATLLTLVKAEPLVALSRYGDASLSHRLVDFSGALVSLDAESTTQALSRLKNHRWPALSDVRLARAAMAANLVRWMNRPAESDDASLSELAQRYQLEIAWVDWARTHVLEGDDLPELAAAYAHLRTCARARREGFDRAFAARLDLERPDERRLLGIEFALERCITKVAEMGRVLLVVVDGMSMSVFLELAESIRVTGWAPCSLTSAPWPVLLTMLPSTTEASRTSLLSGTATRGDAGSERAAFSAYPGLLAHSIAGKPPRLFHKADLFGASGISLADPLLETLRDSRQRVVGVVLNAVDDHLAKSDQLRLRWSLDKFRALDAILAEARSSERTVILTSDHGHVLDQDTELYGSGPNARWREPNLELRDGEVEIRGPRVHAACGADRIVVAWNERLRYASKRNGYHGGCSPAEALVPFATFRFAGTLVEPWIQTEHIKPSWWGN